MKLSFNSPKAFSGNQENERSDEVNACKGAATKLLLSKAPTETCKDKEVQRVFACTCPPAVLKMIDGIHSKIEQIWLM